MTFGTNRKGAGQGYPAYGSNRQMSRSGARSSVSSPRGGVPVAERYARMTVPQLQAALRARGLPATGRKVDLIARLEGSD